MARRAPSPTVADVAREAGVSRATAARALGGYGQVSPRARHQVLEAARALDYRPNGLARSMITGRTHTIGLLLANIENPFFAQAARGISDVARAHGFEVLLANTDEDADRERTSTEMLCEKQVDGLIVAPATATQESHLTNLAHRKKPLVQFDRVVPSIGSDAVVVDNEEAAFGATAHLLDIGHRRIAFVCGAVHSAQGVENGKVALEALISPGAGRMKGYLTALRRASITPNDQLVCLGDYTTGFIGQKVRALLSRSDPPTAFISTDSITTLGILAGIQESGKTIPGDVSVIGFDDSQWATITQPPLTVIAQPVYELGATACRRLIARIQGLQDPPLTIVLETRRIHRGSSAAPGPRIRLLLSKNLGLARKRTESVYVAHTANGANASRTRRAPSLNLS